MDQDEYIPFACEEVLFEFPVELFEDERLVGPQLTARNENAVFFYGFSSPYDFRIESIAFMTAL
jgi:hypothetical protein